MNFDRIGHITIAWFRTLSVADRTLMFILLVLSGFALPGAVIFILGILDLIRSCVLPGGGCDL